MLLDELEAERRLTVAQLRRIFARESGGPNFSPLLAEAVASGAPQLERNGAWLLGRFVDKEGGIAAKDWEVVLDGLAGVKDWVARLELCQILARHPALLAAAPDVVAHYLRDCVRDPKPFVRAWAYAAWHALGKTHAAYRAEARRVLAAARRDPPKSVQARLRQLAA